MKRFIGAIFCSWMFLASAASAQDGQGSIKDNGPHERPMDLSVMGYISPFYYNGLSFGVVGRFEIPIVPDGFIPAINDQFSLEPSFGVGWRRYDYDYYGTRDEPTFLELTPALYGMWSFHINPKFRPYAALGLGGNIGIWTNNDDYPGVDSSDVHASYFYWDLTVGLFFNFSEYVWFRAELGKGGPKAGLAFAL